MDHAGLNEAIFKQMSKWREYGPRDKTLQDFACNQCGEVRRLYVTVEGMSRLGRCACGGELKLHLTRSA